MVSEITWDGLVPFLRHHVSIPIFFACVLYAEHVWMRSMQLVLNDTALYSVKQIHATKYNCAKIILAFGYAYIRA